MHLRQWRHFHRVVGDECRLYERSFAELAEQFVYELALAHCLVHFHAFLLAEVAYFLLALAVHVEAGFFLNGIEYRQSAVGSLERNEVAVNHALGLSVHGGAYFFEQLLGERHHPVIVLVLHVQFHACELRVVVAVHTFVSEVLAYLVDTFEAAHDESFQVELGSDAHVHVLVQCVEMRRERACRCSSGYRLQCRRLHFGISCVVEHAAQGAQHGGALQEGVLHALVYHEVDISLSVAQFGVVELVVSHAVLVFHYRQRFQALRQQGHFLSVYRYFARLRAEDEALYAHEVAYVEQSLERRVVYRSVCRAVAVGLVCLCGSVYVVASNVDLYSALRVLQLCEGSLAHHAASHQSSGYAHFFHVGAFLDAPCAVLDVVFYVGRESIGWVLGCRIGVDAHVAQFLQALSAAYFLFTQF